MQRADSLEKTLILGMIEGRRRRWWQSMRWLGSIIDSTDMNLTKLQEIVKDREAWLAAVHGFTKSCPQLSDWRTTASSVQSLSHVRLFATPRTTARQASLSITNSRSLLRLMSIVLVMPSNHLICHSLLLPPSIFTSIRVFSNELVLGIKWPEYWSLASASVLPMNIQD